MPHPVTAGFHHVTLVCRDAGRTLAFYRDLLGLRLVKRTVNADDPAGHHLYFGDEVGRPGTLVTVSERPDAPRGRWGIGGIHHLALGVTTDGSLLRWKRWLQDRGVAVGGPFDRVWFRSLYLRDPDGQTVELATPGPGYAVDEPPDALGEREIVPDAEHLRGARDEEGIREATHPHPVESIDEGMAIVGLHHLSGITDDLDVMGTFLESALGLRLVKRSVNQDAPDMKHWFWARYDGSEVVPGSALSFFAWPASGQRAREGSGQIHHLAFRARDEDEQGAWRERLLGMGIPVSDVEDRLYYRSIQFRAPDGLLCEIATDGPGFTVDEPAEELGTTLRLPPRLEGRRPEVVARLGPLDGGGR